MTTIKVLTLSKWIEQADGDWVCYRFDAVGVYAGDQLTPKIVKSKLYDYIQDDFDIDYGGEELLQIVDKIYEPTVFEQHWMYDKWGSEECGYFRFEWEVKEFEVNCES